MNRLVNVCPSIERNKNVVALGIHELLIFDICILNKTFHLC